MDRRKFTLGLAGLGLIALALFAVATLAFVDKSKEIETARSQKEIANRVVSKVEQVADAATVRIATTPQTRRFYRERVELPTLDRGKYWLTFLFPPQFEQDEESKRLFSFFATQGGDSRLIEMRTNTCRVNDYALLEAKQREQWLKYVGTNAPMVVLQKPDGQMVFKCSRGNIPESADELVERIQAAVDAAKSKPAVKPAVKPVQQPEPTYFQRRGRRFSDTSVVATLASYVTTSDSDIYGRRRCTPVAPVDPVPPETPDFDTPIEPLPDTPVDEVEAAKADDPAWLIVLLGIAGVGVGVVLGRKSR